MAAPLTKTQYGLYVECSQHAGEPCYNIPYLYVFDGSLDAERLRQAIEKAVANHPELFTRIELNADGEPVQRVAESVEFKVECLETSDIEYEKANFIQPFDLLKDQLFRMRLLRDKAHYYLLQDIHHIISDGTSRQVLLADIERAYNGERLEVRGERLEEANANADFEADKAWYAAHFDCSDTYSPLLNDLEETVLKEGKLTHQMAIEPARVEQFCKVNGIYKSTFFTSVYAFLLAKYNNEPEVLFNTIYNGRNKENAHRIGMFVRTFPMYTKWDNETKVLDWLKDVQELTSGCREHTAYGYSDAIHDLGLQCATEFAWHGDLFAKDTFAGKPLQQQRLNNNTRECPVYIKAFSRDGHLFVEAEYSANSYSEALMGAFLESYEAIAEGFLKEQQLRDIELVTPLQIALLDSFNQTDVDYDATQTVVSLFRTQAAKTPDNIAVVYQDTRLTYREVDERSNAIAAEIDKIVNRQSSNRQSEPVVSILINRSEWMVLASLGVLKAGCAYQPLDPSYPQERLNFMMKDANAAVLIADEDLRPIVNEYTGPVLLTKELSTNELLSTFNSQLSTVKPNDLFILLYTSGSTGVPKGCQLTHANLVAFIHWYQRFYGLKPEHKIAAYASYGFDACMMDMYPALTCGAAVHIIPEEIRLDLIALNDYFEREHITHSFMTTQVGYQFATSIENHSLLHLSTGGEKLASLTPPAGFNFYNGYGPTECTIFTTTYRVAEKLNNIPIGKPLDNMRLYIVDAQGHRLPVGASGELWVAGPQVSRGYLNRPEKTAEVYIANPFETEDKYARIYRTGDIVRYLPDGNISFVGRRDGQVKIRGFRIELKEVESVIREFPGIKDVTVQAFDEDGGGKFVAAYIVSDQTIDIEALNAFILDQKPPYMVPAVTMQIDAIPLNQNQKVNKRALPKPEAKANANANAESAAPLNVLEQELHDMIAKIVNTEDFGVTTILGYVGLTSISSIKLAVQVNKRFGVTLNSKALVKGGSIQSIENEILAAMLNGEATKRGEVAINSAAINSDSAPLSYAQTGVYFECLKNPTSTIYNIPYLLSYPAGITAEQVAKAVKELVEAHPEMHIHFTTEGDTIIQTLADRVPVQVPITEMSDAELVNHKTEFVQPFNLSKAPLYRFEVVKTESGVHLLMDTHHLIFDGGSADLFIRQLGAALEGQAIEPESYTYLQFVADQQRAEESEEFAAAKAFFAEKLATFESASEIPSDLPKTTEQGFIGEAVCPAPHDQVAAFCRKHEITAAHLYLAAVSYVVSRYTNNHDVFLSTISSGRSNLKIADTIGMFVNTLAIGLKIDEGTIADYLKQVSSTFDTTLEHENYPFARINADFGFVPSIAYAYQVGVLSEYKVNGQAIGQELLELNVPKFPINIKIESRGVVVQYDDARYSARAAQGLADSIVAVAERMIAEPAAKLRKLSIISAAQEEELSRMREVATAEVPFHYYHECIPYYAKKTPDALALVACDASYTYKQFDALTNRIANALRARGVAPRSRVALLQPRTSKVFLSIFGVMKAGCAYIPCDPEYPTERIQHILTDSHAPFVITTADRLAEFPGKAIDVDELLAEPNEAPIDAGITPQDLCYLIYTSGSTGKPKGVMLRHESIANYLYNHPANTHIHAIAETVRAVLCVTTISFDMSMKEFGGALFNGKTAVIANEEETKDAAMLADLFKRTGADAINATPSRMLQYMELEDFVTAIGQCHVIMCGGEKYADGLLDKLRAAAPNARIFNTYGPTEITVSSNCKELTHTDRVSVGRPLLNYHEFVVDSDGNELPAGVVGELYIGGIGVASGYNDLPDMTAERFIDYKGFRIYKSGDYARWTEEGDVVILGRTDNQIKLRGLRIELGEVEAALAAVEGIKVAVVKIGKIKGIEHLCAYFTADRPIDIPTLKAEMGKTLTKYMVPTAYKQMDKMPITPNGKTDIKNLPEPELALSGDYEAPANETERIFCEIFANILQLDKVGATDNFFELGGTSLVVTRVIIEADKAGKHVSYGEVFAHPTPRQLAELLGDSAKPIVNDEKVDHFDYTAINNLLQRNTLETFRQGQSQGQCQPLGNVLITGSTGYLGIHILHDLIDSDAEHIYCMVRGKTVEAAESRLRTLLYYYFANAYKDLFGKRLHIVLGDVTADFDEKLKVDTVFNCAAIVKHFSEGTEIEDVNIGGAQRCVEFCIKTGAKLVHVSTASTRGLWVGEIKDDVYTEQRLYMGQYLGNQYIYSKYMAERIILEAVALHGLSAKIMRVGNLAARSTDGEFQANFSTNSFMGRIRVYSMLGCCPYAMRNKNVEFSPINEVAHAIVLLATTPKDCTVFHPYNIHGQFLGDVLTGLTSIGQGIRFVEQEEFNAAIEEAGNDPQKAKQMSALLAYKDMAHGQKTADVKRDNDYTTQVLYRLGFSWSPTSWDYVERMLNAISGFGFFD